MVCHLRGTFWRNFKYDRQIWPNVVSPVLLNIAMIATALFPRAKIRQSLILPFAIGIFLGGLLQFLFQIPFLKKAGLLVKPKWAWHDEG